MQGAQFGKVMTLKKLAPGMKVYDVRPASNRWGGSKYDTWPVIIKEINHEEETVLASWNHNRPTICHKREWSKWRLNQPK